MAKLRLGMTMSIDGFIANHKGSSEPLYTDLASLRNSSYMQEEISETGAVVMGRHAYDMAHGDLTGYEFQVPIFVLTHNPPKQPIKGENDNLSVTFVTDGIENAVERAKTAAGDKYVVSIGGADTAHQLLNAGLVDELQVDIMPILLKRGLRFFDYLKGEAVELEKIKVREVGPRTSIRFRVLKQF
jgi:dihydrofolate reductase